MKDIYQKPIELAASADLMKGKVSQYTFTYIFILFPLNSFIIIIVLNEVINMNNLKIQVEIIVIQWYKPFLESVKFSFESYP